MQPNAPSDFVERAWVRVEPGEKVEPVHRGEEHIRAIQAIPSRIKRLRVGGRRTGEIERGCRHV